MKLRKLAALMLCVGSVFSLSGCQKASNITKVCMLKTVDSMNLYLTANAKGMINNSYIYLNEGKTNKEYAEEVYAKVHDSTSKKEKQRPNCDIAYFPVHDTESSLKYLFELEKKNNTDYFKIVYIDAYNYDSEGHLYITGVWVGRQGWINNTNNTGRKFVDGLAKAANYRMATMYDNEGSATDAINSDYKMAHSSFKDQKKFNTFKEMFTFMEEKYKNNQLPDYVFNDKNDKIVNYKSIYEYCALFALQNRGLGQPFNDDKVLTNFINTSLRDNGGAPFINNSRSEELYGSLKDIGKTAETDKPISTEGQELLTALETKVGIDDTKVNLNLMRHGIAHANDESSSGSKTKAIIWACVGGGLILIILILLIIRRIKTGKKLFDIKRALDADIDPENPRIVRMKKVAKDLKALREDKKLTIKEASKAMHIPAKYMEDIIEAGELVLNKRDRKKYIEFYNLPLDYFDKAYQDEEDKK